MLTHQSRSFPGGQPRLNRSPSLATATRTGLEHVGRQGHRGSSPSVRPLLTQDALSPPPRFGRSPSPLGLRTASLDTRCVSPTPPSPSASINSFSDCSSPLLSAPKSPTPSDAPPPSPLGTLQPDLYQRSDGPILLPAPSCHVGPPLGRLHFRVHYDFDKSDLHVHLIEAHDLAGSDQGGFNDPYVKLSLTPEVDNRKRQTAIHRRAPHPMFDEKFRFPVAHVDLADKTLVLQVFDYDRFSRNDVVGEVRMRLCDFDITSSVEVWGEIGKNRKPPEELQEVLVSLSYLPSAERLTVVLLKARNLFLPLDKDVIDPFVKVYLVVGGRRTKKKKTAARKGTINPVWNEALSFNVAAHSLANTAVEVCVMDQASDLIGNSAMLGCCVVGPHEAGPGGDHWADMEHNPRKAVAMWHTLR